MDLRRTKNNNNNNNNSSLTGGSLHNSFSFVFFPPSTGGCYLPPDLLETVGGGGWGARLHGWNLTQLELGNGQETAATEKDKNKATKLLLRAQAKKKKPTTEKKVKGKKVNKHYKRDGVGGEGGACAVVATSGRFLTPYWGYEGGGGGWAVGAAGLFSRETTDRKKRRAPINFRLAYVECVVPHKYPPQFIMVC
jgi:hypothetical protein